MGLAHSLQKWVWDYFEDNSNLPVNVYHGSLSRIAEDEDLAQEIHEHLHGLRKKYFTAMDIVRFLETPDIKARFKLQKSPSERTARRWLHTMEYRYGKPSKGMFIDGHERADVVDYRQNVFLSIWAALQERIMLWNRDSIPTDPKSCSFPNRKRVVLLTHDESTFYAHDRQETRWIHNSENPTPAKKGEGSSIMVSNFCSPDLGWLKSKDGTREVQLLFKAGKNRDGYFSCEDLCAQTELCYKLAIELFEDNFPGTAVALFAFDNAPSHQKRASDGLSSLKMPKFPKLLASHDGKTKMRNGVLPNGESQSFYYSDDHPTMPGYFKGMSRILEERSFIEEAKLPASCEKLKCKDSKASRCCWQVLYNQPDFVGQKSALVELIEAHGHLVIFYPKFHCELNFIEQCWGATKSNPEQSTNGCKYPAMP
ncbi:hypothetical protein M422DRAFT_162848 [Sphaerobolus stellatus SS14]|nr:hypothetical protein M422DRAFT_162848 [Sphaerobolus stellatus SS14]